MTTYNASIWPPLEIPEPTNESEVGGTFEAPPAPPMVLPEGTNETGNGGTFEAAPIPNFDIPAAPVSATNWEPVPYANASQQTSYVYGNVSKPIFTDPPGAANPSAPADGPFQQYVTPQ